MGGHGDIGGLQQTTQSSAQVKALELFLSTRLTQEQTQELTFAQVMQIVLDKVDLQLETWELAQFVSTKMTEEVDRWINRDPS